MYIYTYTHTSQQALEETIVLNDIISLIGISIIISGSSSSSSSSSSSVVRAIIVSSYYHY